MAPPPFSTLSAISELLVTGAVFYAFWPAYRGRMFRGGLLAVALVYETLFNITYMTRQLVSFGRSPDIEPGIVWLAILHGIFSLVMFVGLLFFAGISYKEKRAGVNFPAERLGFLTGFLVLWSISVLSGEVLYATLYL